MTKFAKPFNEYEVTWPMSKMVGIDGRVAHPELRQNPIYYFNHFQFEGGSLIRAVLGREVIWDQEVENAVIDGMERQYGEAKKLDNYDLQAYRCTAIGAMNIRGNIWTNGIKPTNKSFYTLNKYECIVKPDDCVYLRTHSDHYDIEVYDHRSNKEMVLTVNMNTWSLVKSGFKKLRGSKIYELKRRDCPKV